MIVLCLALLAAPQEFVRTPTEATDSVFQRLERFPSKPSGILAVLQRGELVHTASIGENLRAKGSPWDRSMRVPCPEWTSTLLALTATHLHDEGHIDLSEHVGATLKAFDTVPGPLTLDDLIADTTHLRPVKSVLWARGRGELGRVGREDAVASLARQVGGGASSAPLSCRFVLEEALERATGKDLTKLLEGALPLAVTPGKGPLRPLARGQAPDHVPAVTGQREAWLSLEDLVEILRVFEHEVALPASLDRHVVRPTHLGTSAMLQRIDSRRTGPSTAIVEHLPSGVTILFVGSGRAGAQELCLEVLVALLLVKRPVEQRGERRDDGGGRVTVHAGGSQPLGAAQVRPGKYEIPGLELPLRIRQYGTREVTVTIGAGGQTTIVTDKAKWLGATGLSVDEDRVSISFPAVHGADASTSGMVSSIATLVLERTGTGDLVPTTLGLRLNSYPGLQGLAVR